MAQEFANLDDTTSYVHHQSHHDFLSQSLFYFYKMPTRMELGLATTNASTTGMYEIIIIIIIKVLFSLEQSTS